MALNTIKRPFLHQSGDKFADLVEEHLKLVMPNITQSKRLGDLDQQGIDVLQFEENEGGVLQAVQCKGYERPYNTIHTDGLIKEIRKFLNKGPDVNEYWLVINKPIIDRTDRQKIERELTELEKVGKVKRTMLLDLDPFAKHLEALAIEKFRFLASANRIATKT